MYLFSSSLIFSFFLLHICLLFIGSAIAYTRARKFDVFGMAIVTVLAIVMNFSRTGLGVDEPVYLDAYKDFIRDGTVYFEYSFNFLYFIFSHIGVSPDFFNFSFSTFFVILASYVVKKCVHSPYQTLALVFFLFFSITLDFEFNAYRQGMAFLFIMLFIGYCQFGGKKRGLVCFLIALGFHWSSIVVLLAVLLRKILTFRYAVRLNLILIFLTLIAAVIPLGIISRIGNILSVISFGSPYVTKVMMYLESPVANFYDLNILGRMPLIMAVVSMLIVIYIYRHFIPLFYYKIVILLMSYCLIFLEMSYSFRNYYWVLPILPFLMANIPSYVDTRRKSNVAIIVMLSVHILLAFTGYYTSGIIPLIFA